jgi:hypothetical protein
MDHSHLVQLRENIESLSVFHQKEILRILHINKVTLCQNKNGVFINLTYVDSSIIQLLSDYLNYVKKQEFNLSEIEDKKQTLSTQYFT